MQMRESQDRALPPQRVEARLDRVALRKECLHFRSDDLKLLPEPDLESWVALKKAAAHPP
jgi:hypothetical protein